MLVKCSTTERPVFPGSKTGPFPLPRMVDKNSALDQLGRVRILVLLAGYVTVGRLLCSSKPILSSVKLG